MKLASINATYTQDADCCAGSDLDQGIAITVENGGAGPYIVISTARWAVGDEREIDDFARLLKETLAKVEWP
jgi:hypothetical protein